MVAAHAARHLQLPYKPNRMSQEQHPPIKKRRRRKRVKRRMIHMLGKDRPFRAKSILVVLGVILLSFLLYKSCDEPAPRPGIQLAPQPGLTDSVGDGI